MDPALWEALRAEAGTDGDRVLEAVIRLARPGIEIPDVRMVARFGTVATCRIQARDVIAVRARDDVLSLKASRGISPGFEPADPGSDDSGAADAEPDDGDPAALDPGPADVRRDLGLGLTGAGVVVAAVDWGVDVDWAGFRWPQAPEGPGPGPGPGQRPGGTRLLAPWDQRDQAAGPRAEPYGYGAVHRRAEIDRALADPRPYERLGYHPAIADRRGRGSHGTRTLDIAAGNGQAGGLPGIAPGADLVFVHLADRDSGGLANFGDSVRLLEAVDFISRTAGPQPCAINISAGRLCGPRDGSTLVERAFDELLAGINGRFIADSAGNYYRWRAHARGAIEPGQEQALSVIIEPTDITLSEVEVWYDGADELAVRIEPPGYAASRPVRLGERSDLVIGGRVAGRVYHRRHDPNNGDNHIVVYLDPIGLAGPWTVTLTAVRIDGSGQYHAWIERDDSCPGCQARFTPDDASVTTTLGSIATSHLPLVVGAYDGHDPDRTVATFSSAGPSRDARRKPDLVAPGVRVLAARSAPAGASRNPGLLVRGSGTSFAAPHVTGAVALCFEAAGDRLSAARLRALILDSCDPAPEADPDCRYGRGYLNIPRLAADVRRALAAPPGAPATKEAAMATEDTTVLMEAGAATAYREYLYRPDGQLARRIGEHFELVAGPGQRLSRAPQPGDVLLEVTLGWPGPGRCVPLDGADLMLVARQPRLAAGQLLLRPRPRAELTGPWSAEPALGAANPGLTFTLGEGPGDAESATPVRVAAGQLVIEHVAQLRSHVGTPPDMVLTWNAMELPGPVDVVVHLHGFSSRGRWMRLPTDMVPVSGLDFADPDHPSIVGRTGPALLVLPRGNYFGGRSGRGYDFPALHPPGALQALVDDAVARFAAQVGGEPAVGRLILTAHSGGGVSLMRILRYADPSEVHTFDALYTDPTPLTGWAHHRMAQGNGALRVLFRPGEGTAPGSLSVAAALRRAAMAAGVELGPRWRVESTRVPHVEIPRRFGWRLLADPAADLPGADPAAGAPAAQEAEAAEDTSADWGLYGPGAAEAPAEAAEAVTAAGPAAYWSRQLRFGLAGNTVEPLMDGPAAFQAIQHAIESADSASHFIYLLAWWADPWVNLTGPGTSLLDLFARAGERGVQIRVLMWEPSRLVAGEQARLHDAAVDALNRLPNCHAQQDSGQALAKSHHQKLLVVQGRGGLVALCGGVDVNADRVHDLPPPPGSFRADRPAVRWTGSSGSSGPAGSGNPLHDVHARLTGPTALPLLRAFLRRWWARSGDRAIDRRAPLRGEFLHPVPAPTGSQFVRVGETFNGVLRLPGGDVRSRQVTVQDIWLRSILGARRFIYMEDQYLISDCAARAIRSVLPRLDHVTILIPPSEITDLPGVWARRRAFLECITAGNPDAGKLRVYTRTPGQPPCHRVGVPHSYVHAKMAVIDDELMLIGSANCNNRGWETDSELVAASFEDASGPGSAAGRLRAALWAHHLGVPASAVADPLRSRGLWDTASSRLVCRYDPSGRDRFGSDRPDRLADPSDRRPGDPCLTLLGPTSCGAGP